MAPRSGTRPSGSRSTPKPLPAAASAAGLPPAPRPAKRWILAFTGAVLSLGWLSLAQAPSAPAWAAEPGQPPGRDGQLLLLPNDRDRTNIIELEQDQVKEIPFSGEALRFRYGVTRDRKEERRAGAVIVKVVYLYDSGQEDIKVSANYTELFRTAFPNRRGELENSVRRPYYVNYHKEEKDNLFLIHNFHTIFREGERTDGTRTRKWKFLYTSEPQWNPEVRRQRTQLLYYSGVDDTGTWIPFWVGIDHHMSDILITVVDLGQPAADLPERVWPIHNKK